MMLFIVVRNVECQVRKKYKKKGGKFLDGFSDHFPIYMLLAKEL